MACLVCKRAFSIIAVFVLLSVVSLITLGQWKRLSMSYDVVCCREEWYKNFYLADFLLYYGINKHVIPNFSSFFYVAEVGDGRKEFDLKDGLWEWGEDTDGVSAFLEVDPVKKAMRLLVSVALCKQGEVVCKIVCVLFRLAERGGGVRGYFVDGYELNCV